MDASSILTAGPGESKREDPFGGLSITPFVVEPTQSGRAIPAPPYPEPSESMDIMSTTSHTYSDDSERRLLTVSNVSTATSSGSSGSGESKETWGRATTSMARVPTVLVAGHPRNSIMPPLQNPRRPLRALVPSLNVPGSPDFVSSPPVKQPGRGPLPVPPTESLQRNATIGTADVIQEEDAGYYDDVEVPVRSSVAIPPAYYQISVRPRPEAV